MPLVLMASSAHAQYFGRNKVQYRTFEFQILPTEHFDIYYYPEEAESAQIGTGPACTHAHLCRLDGRRVHICADSRISRVAGCRQ